MKDLVIVESPTKARTISKILGNQYTVAASMGHVRDLPENTLGVNISNHFQPYYQITKKSVVANLKKLCHSANTVYLAPDPDREGEAIAWHIKELLAKELKCDFRRVVFHEITKTAVSEAFKHPGDINMNLVNSQQARRILDRIVGYKISEMLWSKISKGLSAGRVQSVALRIICEREREIQNFVPEEYWLLNANFAKQNGLFEYKGKLVSVNGQKIANIKAVDAEKIAKAIEENNGSFIDDILLKRRQKYAPPPFITSTLQQTAVQYLRMTASQTMRIAQQLYEGIEIGGEGATGLITYMRTDSFNVSMEALGACRAFISQNFGEDFLPEKPNFFKSARTAQEAHEAIRPTSVFRTPESIRNYLSTEQFKLYSLIWKRFVASQTKPAEYDVVTVSTIVNGSDKMKYEFKTTGSTLVFDGYLKVYEINTEEDKSGENDCDNLDARTLLSSLEKGENVLMKCLNKEQKFTEPPARFSEATLIKELESNGIGRPSTYATILSTILSRKYVEKVKGRLLPTELGFKVNDILIRTLGELFQVGYTAQMEAELDKIEEGGLEWRKMLFDFYSQFSLWLKNAKLDGAPEDKNIKVLIEALDSVKNWELPDKGRGRKFNDKKFFESVKEYYNNAGTISEKQWKALLSLIVKYREQIENFKEISESFSLSKMIEKKEADDREKKLPHNVEKNQKIMNVISEILKIIKEQKNIDVESNVKGRYDDSKFLYSFSKRLSSGGILSEKQLSVLSRIILKYKDKISSYEDLKTLLNIDENALSVKKVERKMTGEQDNTKIAEIISQLNKIQDWQGSGRRNDKSFFLSLAKQFTAKKTLSEKQYLALQKLASKYLLGEHLEQRIEKK
ncbi:MAG TPA: type I DNA topoisomerase [Victivallales bacterium]|nr:type I DNA topoisomerase [Victivallales bacterium]